MPSWLRRLAIPHDTKWPDEDPDLSPSLHIDMPDKSHNFPQSKSASPVTSILPPPATHTHCAPRRKRSTETRFNAFWKRLRTQLVPPAPSTSSHIDVGGSTPDNTSPKTPTEKPIVDENGEVNEVVLDRVWSDEFQVSDSPSERGAKGISRNKSGVNANGANITERESLANKTYWPIWKPFVILRYKAYPLLLEFFFTRFGDEKSESHYAQEDWILKKSLALWGALWLIVNWVLGVAFLDGIKDNKFIKADIVFYFVVGPLLAFPVLWMVIYDWPRDRPTLYQLFLAVAIWAWGFYFVLFIKICDFYNPHEVKSCQSRDFLGLFFYTTALQTMGLFGLKLNRLMAAVGAISFFVMTSILMIPARDSWVRNMINFFVFHFFLIYVHYMRENSERRLYTLRYQLKIQYRATQKAQVNERKTADSKRRLTSYVFHDKSSRYLKIVRVPLNTALLAVQNMEATNSILKDQEVEFNALSGSLSMMSKVLNDVLDFNKMDSGKFESAMRPYAFHQVMRSLFIPLRMATNARNLILETDLDPAIDIMARKAAYEALGESQETIRQHILAHPDIDGLVAGDETRLRQIINNLASNGCKFTPDGGKLTIRTRLLLPSLPSGFNPLDFVDESADKDKLRSPLSASHLTTLETDRVDPLLVGIDQEKLPTPKQTTKTPSLPKANVVTIPADTIVVRIEVEDSGCGIQPGDMHKLFTAFNQTEQGKQQGGKGTGLGLALVRQIVKLTGGRLGLQSKVGRGSTFWVEIPLGIGRSALLTHPPLPDAGMSHGSSHVEYEHGQVLRTGVFEAEAAASRAQDLLDKLPRIPSAATSANSKVAMQGLMDQAGRVELVLKEHDSEARRQQKGGGGKVTGGTPVSSGDATPLATPSTEIFSQQAMITDGSATTTKRTGQRPTFVQLPAPRTFDHHQIPAVSPSALSSYSNSSTSPLTLFDAAHARGSPSSLNAGCNFEAAAGMSVLVVDDDPLTRTLMKRILTRLGCHVTVAENGEMALEMILGRKVKVPLLTPSSDVEEYTKRESMPILEQDVELGLGSSLGLKSNETWTPDGETPVEEEYRFAIIFLDNQMPVMSGLRVVAKLRELRRTDFVVGVTGNALLTDQQEYLEAGVDRVLTKPVLERSLREVLQLADERRKNIPGLQVMQVSMQEEQEQEQEQEERGTPESQGVSDFDLSSHSP